MSRHGADSTLRTLIDHLADPEHDRSTAERLRKAVRLYAQDGHFPLRDRIAEYMAWTLYELASVPDKQRPAWVWEDANLALYLWSEVTTPENPQPERSAKGGDACV